MLHAGAPGIVYPVGTLAPWLTGPITLAPVDPIPVDPTPVDPEPVDPPPVGSAGVITGLTLVNAGTDVDQGDFTSGATLDLAAGSYSVRANVSGVVGSVVFAVDGTPVRTESTAPFSVAGDSAGDYAAWSIAAGAHTLSVTPYAGGGATGEAGQPVSVSFTVVGAPVAPAGFTTISYTTKASSPIARSEALTARYNDRLYVFGGFNLANGPVMTSHYYTPANNSWTQIRDLPLRLTHVGMAQNDTTVYFVGGYYGNPGKTGYGQVFGTTKVYAYDFASDVYTEIKNLPRPLAGGGAALVGRKLHYFGGYELNRTDTNVHLVLDLDNQAAGWLSAAPMVNSRNHMGAVVVGGKIYAVAGQTGTDAGLVTQKFVEVYDPDTNAWSSRAPIPAAVSHIASATFVMGDRIIVMGGESAHEQQVRTCFAYTPATDTWVQLTSLPAARFSGVANEIGGKIYFTTGGNSTTTWQGTV